MSDRRLSLTDKNVHLSDGRVILDRGDVRSGEHARAAGGWVARATNQLGSAVVVDNVVLNVAVKTNRINVSNSHTDAHRCALETYSRVKPLGMSGEIEDACSAFKTCKRKVVESET